MTHRAFGRRMKKIFSGVIDAVRRIGSRYARITGWGGTEVLRRAARQRRSSSPVSGLSGSTARHHGDGTRPRGEGACQAFSGEPPHRAFPRRATSHAPRPAQAGASEVSGGPPVKAGSPPRARPGGGAARTLSPIRMMTRRPVRIGRDDYWPACASQRTFLEAFRRSAIDPHGG